MVRALAEIRQAPGGEDVPRGPGRLGGGALARGGLPRSVWDTSCPFIVSRWAQAGKFESGPEHELMLHLLAHFALSKAQTDWAPLQEGPGKVI